jgi:hypothetical protein
MVLMPKPGMPLEPFFSMKNNSNIGRNLFYILTDEVTGKYLGVICISSDFLDLTEDNESDGQEILKHNNT